VKHLALNMTQAAVLYEIATMAIDGHDQQTILDAIVQAVHDLAAARTTTLALAELDDSLVVIARCPAPTLSEPGEPLTAESSAPAQAISERRCIVVTDTVGVAPETSIRTCLAVPLIWQHEVLGVLTLTCVAPRALASEIVDIVGALTRQAAATVGTFRDRDDEIRLRAEAAEISRQFAEQAYHLERVQEQLIQTEKLAAVAQLVHGLAHQMNTPLSVVITNLTVLKQYSDVLAAVARAAHELLPALVADGPDGPSAALAAPLASAVQRADLAYTLEDLPELVKDSTTAAQRAAELVRNMGTFAQGKTGWPEGVEIQEVLEAAITLSSAGSSRTFPEVRREYGVTPPVLGFRTELAEVFQRLFTNADQALEDATGTITVTTSYADSGVAVRIHDTGHGIGAEDLGRVFDPFFTTRPASVGTGMGLAVCYGIITRHGGSIALESEPGAGTAVTVVLPAVALG
jgi:signal transduction histidine kinase